MFNLDTKLLAWDIETSGTEPEYALQAWRLKQGKAWITSLAWAWGEDGLEEINGGLNPTVDDFRRMFQFAIDNDMTLVGWHQTFDLSWAFAMGLGDLAMRCKYADGMLLWRHLTIEPEYDGVKKSYSLKAAVREFLPEHAGYEADVDFHDESEEARKALHEYNIKDTVFTLKIAKILYNRLAQSPKQLKAALIEAECLPLIAQANVEGIPVDMDKAHALVDHLTNVANEKLAELQPHGVTEAIVRSPKQLAELIYDTWQLPVQGTTGSGARSTDKTALHELSLIDPRAKLIREYKEALNNKTKFAETIIESVQYNDDGCTHPEARVFGTYSGRLTYSSNQGRGKGLRQTGFAIHQMKRGKEYRSLIKAPEGYTLIEYDASGQEFRWMALASKDPIMLDLCMPGKDPHAYMGNRINPDANDKKAARQLGKVANLSLQYRTSAKKLCQVARVQYGLPMDIDQATNIHRTYQEAYTGVPRYWHEQISRAKIRGFAETAAGRRVLLGGDWSGQFEWSMGSTAINYKIQGTGADQKYLALKYLKPYIIEIGARFAWDLHDGIYLFVPDDRVDDALRTIKRMLDELPYKEEWGFNPSIPLPWDAKVGTDWGSLTEFVFAEKSGAGAGDQSGSLNREAQPLSGDRDRGANRDLVSRNSVQRASPQVATVIAHDFRKEIRDRALEKALELADAGLKVFPCNNVKEPVYGFKNWENVASSDPETIRWWFLEKYKDTASMVGLPCGANNILVLDPDVPKPAEGKLTDGLAAFNQLVDDLSVDLTNVPVINSPSGGKHYIFKQPANERYGCSTGELPKGIDVKGDGGYVIAMGSERDDGLRYEADPQHPPFLSLIRQSSLPEIPEALASLLRTKRKRNSSPAERVSQHLLEEALTAIPNDDYFSDRNDWVDMGHAIWGASNGEEWGKDLWLKWTDSYSGSRTNMKSGFAEKFWDGVKNASSGAGYIRKQLERVGEIGLRDEVQKESIASEFDDDDEPMPEPDPGEKEKAQERANLYADAAFFSGKGKRQREPYLVKGLITARGLTYIAGQPSAGKSAIAVKLAVCLATGKAFAGRKVRDKMAVIYVAAEAPGTIQDRLDVVEGDGKSHTYPIAVMPLVPNLTDKKARHDFVNGMKIVAQRLEAATGLKVGAVFIDTLARAFEIQDENAAGEMGGVVRAIDEIRHSIDAAGIVIHHMGKDVNAGMRGSNTQNAAADDEIHITGDTSSTHNERNMKHAKSRSFETGAQWWFDLKVVEVDEDEDGDLITAVRVEFKSAPAKKERESSTQVRKRVIEAIKADRHAAISDIAGVVGKSRSTVSEHIKKLREQELIKDEKGVWVVTKEGEKWLKSAAAGGGENQS